MFRIYILALTLARDGFISLAKVRIALIDFGFGLIYFYIPYLIAAILISSNYSS